MRTHQLIAFQSPQRVRRSGIRLLPDACVQGGGRAAPVRELQGRYRVHDYDRTGAAGATGKTCRRRPFANGDNHGWKPA
jgi:hypothetical protein